jgi:uncharacterized protein (TIGR00369 family)
MLSLRDDRYCFACGDRNPIGLGLRFTWDGQVLRAAFTPRKEHQGYADVTHGGIIGTVLDEVMAQAAIKQLGAMAATVEFSVRLRKPLMAGEEAVAEARVTNVDGPLVEASSLLRRTDDGAVVARARARLYRVENEAGTSD